ncbi:hypothetical protein KXR63_00750 [Stutzerimonas chloritidismutans]|uniref:hypothetical protein n=1 Tax=Stutzerimonas chloritidismutans TaxID=203192 RepID=UPI003F17DE34
MQHTDKAIAEFEVWWDRQPHREQFEDVKDQMRNVWLASRAELVVQLPDDGIDDCREAWPGRCRDTFDCGYNFASWRHEQAIEAAGVTVRG